MPIAVTKDSSFAIIAEEDRIFKIDLDRVGAPYPVLLPVAGAVMISALAFDWPNQTLYFSDNRKETISALNVNSFELKWVLTSTLEALVVCAAIVLVL